MRFLIYFSVFLFTTTLVYSQIQGPNNPTSVVDGGEGQISEVWSNPNNAQTQNDTRATLVTSTKNKRTNYLKAQNFGFNIPAGSSILGIAVQVDRYAWVVNGRVTDSRIRIIDATGAIGAIDRSSLRPWPKFDTDTYETYGGIGDTWGLLEWTPAKINNENFGVAIMAKTSNDNVTFNLFVDEVRIVVFYQEGGAARYAVASGNWSSPTSWSMTPGGPPGASVPGVVHDVFIGGGHTITNDLPLLDCNSLTIGTTEAIPTGNLAFTADVSDLTVHTGGLVISSDGDVIGTENPVVTSTGDVTLNAVLTNRNFILRMGAEGTGRSIISGNGSLANLVVPIFVVHTGNITITESLLGESFRLINSSTAHLKYSGATNNTSTLVLDLSDPGNTVEFSQTTDDATDYDIHKLSITFYKLIISGNAPKYYNGPITVLDSLTITSTGILSNQQQTSLTLEGNWTNYNGADGFNPNTCNGCTVIFRGTNPQTITNAAGEQFYKMEVNKTLSTLTADNNIIVDNELLMTSGDFDVGANSLTGTANTVFNDGGLIIGTLGATVPELTGTYTLIDGGITFNGAGDQIIRSAASTPAINAYRTVRFLGSGTKSLSGAITVSKNLVIGGTATLDATSSNFGITLAGDWSNTGTFLAHGGTVTLNGVLTQHITNATGENFGNLIIQNSTSSSAVMLNDSVMVNGILTLTDGHIIASDTSLLSLGVNATVASASDGSHVQGPVVKTISSTSVFDFPIGDGTNYMPASITPTSTNTTTFLAEYFPFEFPAGQASDINHVSAQDHWIVQRTYGTADASITLVWEYASADESEVNKLEDLLIAQWNGTEWISHGSAGTTGDFVSGTIQSNTITSFVQPYFAIASSSFFNPLSNFRYFVPVTGNWNDPGAWSYRKGGPATASEPTYTKQVVIEPGHTAIILDTPADQALKSMLSLTVDGTIIFSDAAAQDITLEIGAGGIALSQGADIIGSDTGDQIQMSGDITLNNALSISHTALKTNFVTQGNTITGDGGSLPILQVTQDNQIFTGNTSFASLEIASSATNNGNITITDNLIGGGVLTNGATGTLVWRGTSTDSQVIDATTPGNTIHLISNVAASVLDIAALAVSSAYYNVILDGTNTYTQTQDLDINGTLTIEEGAVFDNASDNQNLSIGGDWKNNSGPTGFLAGTSDITFDGSVTQNIFTSSGKEEINKLVINNTSEEGLVLKRGAVHVTRELKLIGGVVHTDTTNLLVLEDNAISNEGSATAYIDGPMKKIGDDPFVFPVGDGATWARLGIEDIAGFNATTEFICEYVNDAYANTTSLDESLTYVSTVEHWLLTRVADVGSNASCHVRLYWESKINSGIDDFSDLRVGHYYTGSTGLNWYNFGGILTDNGNGSGSVVSETLLTDFSPITFASEYGFALPVELTSFTADVGEEQSVVISWSTASELHNDYFTVQRSRNGIEFETLFNVAGAGSTNEVNSYSVTDLSPYGGISYYRLQQTDLDGKSTYSKIVAVSLPVSDWSIYPNPSDGSFIQLQMPKHFASKPLHITIVDSRGMTMMKQTVATTQQGRVELTLDSPLRNGAYQVIITDGYVRESKLLVVSR